MSNNRMYMKFASILLASAMGLVWAVPVRAQNLIANGGFETPPYAPSTTITNWTVGGAGHVHEADEGSTSPSHALALNIGGDSEGTTVSQSFSTIVGNLYELDFDAGIFGQPDGTLQLNVQVS